MNVQNFEAFKNNLKIQLALFLQEMHKLKCHSFLLGKTLITSSMLILQEKNKSSCYNTAIAEGQVRLTIINQRLMFQLTPLSIIFSGVCKLKQCFYFSSSDCCSFGYFSSKQESGLNLYLSKYQELICDCRLHIACITIRVCKRNGKAMGSREAEPFPALQPSCLSSCPPSPVLRAPGKGEPGNKPSQAAVLLWSPETPGNKTKQKPWDLINNTPSLWTFTHLE